MIPGLLKFGADSLLKCFELATHAAGVYTERGIEIGAECVLMTTKGEAIAVGIAQVCRTKELIRMRSKPGLGTDDRC